MLRRNVLVVSCLIVCGSCAAPARAEDPPTCLTLVAADHHEPVCNPYLWQSSWDQGHRNPYSQHTTPVAGPRPGEPVTVQRINLQDGAPEGATLGAFFSGLYPDGKRVAWALSVPGENDNPIWRIDPQTGKVLTVYTHLASGQGYPTERAALSGIYVLSDRFGHLIQPHGDRFEVYGETTPGDRTGPIRSLHHFVLPPRARCGSGDRLVGQTMRWDGRIGFVTARGMVGVIPSAIDQMDDAHLIVHSINGDAKCATADRSTAGLETVSNSISGDEDGGMYPVTDHAMYRFDVEGGRIVQTWRTPYKTGTTSSSRQDSGSGSTPALMGTAPGDDKLVVITDGQPLTHMVFLWRGRTVPKDATPVGPGRDPRIACEVPINFGDETLTESQNEQSVAIRGYAALTDNNQLRNAQQIEPIYGPIAEASGLPLQLAVAAFAGSAPQFQPYGAERVDWNPATRSCSVKWVNKTVSLPNGVPTMSSGANEVYGLGVRNGVWGLEGMDFATGASNLWVPVDADPLTNSFYSALSIAPDGSVWSGALAGLTIFRPPPRPEPARTCEEFDPPTAFIAAAQGRALRVAGTAADTGCGGVARVEVAIARYLGHRRCRFAGAAGRLGAPRACGRPRWLHTAGTTAWSLRLHGRLPAGGYTITARAVDSAGNVEAHALPSRRVSVPGARVRG